MEIDAVISWVDGADPAHRAAREACLGPSGGGGDKRFVESGEIYFALASILQYAPFLRRVHIVTDNQRPAFLDAFAVAGLCAPDRFRIVDHDIIFDGLNAARPTFNSRSIEAAIHRIPGLTEHFVYLNDDMAFNRACTREDLFDADGRPRLSGRMQPFSDTTLKARLKRLIGITDTRPSHQIAQETGALLTGASRRFLRVPHRPHPLRVSTMKNALAAHPGLLDRQVSHRVRGRAQYLPVALANHAELANGVVPDPADTTAYLRDKSSTDFEGTLKDIEVGTSPYYCVQGLESMHPERCARVLDVLCTKFAVHLPDPLPRTLRAIS